MTDKSVNDPSGVGEDDVSPNVNCLEGKRCPRCRSWGPFEVAVWTRVLLCDDGTDCAEDGSIEYDDDSPAMCRNCRYKEKFGTFDFPQKTV